MTKNTIFTYAKQRFSTAKFISIMLIIYSLFCLSSAIYSFINNEIRDGLLSLLFFAFTFLFYPIEYLLKSKMGSIFIFICLFVLAGSIFGTCYNGYYIIPFFDTILHGLSGLIFSCFGFTIIQLFIGKPTNKKTFFACLMFAITFSIFTSVIWEIFEYGVVNLIGYDMMEDTYINSFNSYLLSGNHSDLYIVENIEKTIIYYGDNQILTIEGYLDLGLIDTLSDMIIHLITTSLFALITIISYFKFPKLNEQLIPTPIK